MTTQTAEGASDAQDPIAVDARNVTVDAFELARMLGNVLLFVAPTNRPLINCARFTPGDLELTVEATDTYVLYRERVGSVSVAAPPFWVDSATMSAVAKAAKTQKTGQVEITVDPTAADYHQVRFVGVGWSIEGGRTAVEWPQVEKLRSNERGSLEAIGFGSALLAKVGKIKSTDAVSHKDTGTYMRFEFLSELKPVTVKIGDSIDLLAMPVRVP